MTEILLIATALLIFAILKLRIVVLLTLQQFGWLVAALCIVIIAAHFSMSGVPSSDLPGPKPPPPARQTPMPIH